ncbi:MAG TPA: hypothetical protein VNK04_19135 [Gemmataceae bacterium]|nr:hypothetical protein [Gemmataceae bacterium]
MFRLAIVLGVVSSTLVVCTLSGCGSKGPKRHEVTGTVIFKGQPLDVGMIDFEPLDGQGSKSGSGITNGEYKIPRDKGLFPGRYRVSIYGGDGLPSEGAGEPLPTTRGVIRGKERIPAKYNTKSDQIIEVTDDGPNKFDFNIS